MFSGVALIAAVTFAVWRQRANGAAPGRHEGEEPAPAPVPVDSGQETPADRQHTLTEA